MQGLEPGVRSPEYKPTSYLLGQNGSTGPKANQDLDVSMCASKGKQKDPCPLADCLQWLKE